MSRKVLLRAAIALVVVLFAGLSTAGARQLWNQNQARDNAAHAQELAENTLHSARSQGLTGPVADSLARALRGIEAERAPSANPVWDSVATRFYEQQLLRFNHLRARVAATLRQSTATARTASVTALAHLDKSIGSARSLQIDVSSQSRADASQHAAMKKSSTLRGYRQVVSVVEPIAASLDKTVAARQTQINALLSQGGNTTAGVQQLGETQIASARGDLSLLTLFSQKAAAYSSTLDAQEKTLQAATTPVQAALATLTIQSDTSTIEADFAHSVPDKVVVISTENQTAWAYENGKQVMTTPVTTGGPELPTDHGVFHIFDKESPFVFHSPFPLGSPYYYDPTPVQFWMPFDGNEGLHDASWRSDFGPGSNYAPTDLGNGNVILGTHGCVNLPYDAASFLWNWAPVGTTVVVI